MSFLLSELTFIEAKAVLARGAVAFLPCGATEAHGPHLPLETDGVISATAAARACELLRQQGRAGLVLPTLSYAVTEFAAEFAGTISISIEVARVLVRDVVLGAIRTGFQSVVLCNAHLEPGNLRALKEGVELAEAEGARVVFPDITRKPHALLLDDEFKSGACHAGSYETSLVLAARPDLVRKEGRALAPNLVSLSRAIRDGKRNFREAGGPNAYFGNPAAATVEHGRELYETLAKIFADAAL